MKSVAYYELGIVSKSMGVIYSGPNSLKLLSPFMVLLFKTRKSIPISGLILLVHFYRRLYEQFFVARSRSYMSILHYLMGYVFYFLLPIQFIISDPDAKTEISATNILCLVGVVASMICQHLR